MTRCGRSMITPDASATIGRTPLVEFTRLGRGRPRRVLTKLETCSVVGSIEVRTALVLIDDAERRGVPRPGMPVVEPTGGGTVIDPAPVAAVRGHRARLTMPASTAREPVALFGQMDLEGMVTRAGSAVGSRGVRGLHEMPGSGGGRISSTVARIALDGVVAGTDGAVAAASQGSRFEGVGAGISSVTTRSGSDRAALATLLPDTGGRGRSTARFGSIRTIDPVCVPGTIEPARFDS